MRSCTAVSTPRSRPCRRCTTSRSSTRSPRGRATSSRSSRSVRSPASATATRCCAAALRSGAAAGRSSSPASRRPWRRRRGPDRDPGLGHDRLPAAAPGRAGDRRGRRGALRRDPGRRRLGRGRRGPDHPREPLHLRRPRARRDRRPRRVVGGARRACRCRSAAICARNDLGEELRGGRGGRHPALRRARLRTPARQSRVRARELAGVVRRGLPPAHRSVCQRVQRDLGDDGLAAVAALLSRAAEAPA